MARYREGGMDVLKARTIPGRPQKLSGPQLRQIYTLIVGNDPRQLSFEFALWTREMVRELIRREFNVKLSVVSVGRLLRKLGLSPQRPLWRAYQQNLVAVELWKSEVYPAIRTEAATVGATIYFGDEAGVRTDFHAGTTWAPVADSGRTHHWYPRFDQPHLCTERSGSFAFLHLRRYVRVRHFHQLLQATDARHQWLGISHCRRSSCPPFQSSQRLRGFDPWTWTAAPVPVPGLLA